MGPLYTPQALHGGLRFGSRAWGPGVGGGGDPRGFQRASKKRDESGFGVLLKYSYNEEALNETSVRNSSGSYGLRSTQIAKKPPFFGEEGILTRPCTPASNATKLLQDP